MTQASLSLRSSSAVDPDEILVVGAGRGGGGLVLHGGPADVEAALVSALQAVGFTGKKDELVRLPAPAGVAAKSVAVVGLGTAEPDADALRYAAGTVARRFTGGDTVVLDLGLGDLDLLEAVLEGAGIGSYDYTDYRGTGTLKAGADEVADADADGSSSASSASPSSSAASAGAPDADAPVVSSPERAIVVVTTGLDEEAALGALARARASVDAVNLVRDLVNIPALDLYPENYADRVVELAEGRPLDVDVWDYDALLEGGFGGIAGVGQGSTRLPRLVRVDYSPEGATQHIALVGKGITFDTGGLSLKPPVSMIGMKYDMAGSATVLATVIAAAELGLPVRVTAWLCLAENMPSGVAIRPGDVLRIRGGRTVEVLNTDAEGRLVLADGIVIAGEEKPDAIIDVATLTGAAVVALGNRYVATMGDEGLVAEVIAASKAAGETLWPMPLPAELRPLLNSDIADLANVKPGNTAGGMLVAGVFLKEFVGTTDAGDPIPWAHLDIAGAAQNKDGGYGYTVKGPTGATVRTLLRFAEARSRA